MKIRNTKKYEVKDLGVNDPCIRDRDGRICAWCIGMSDEDIEHFLAKYEGTYRSVGRETPDGVR